MERDMRCQMRYYGAPALDISMEPSGRSGVAPPPNSPRGSEDSRSTEPNTLDMGPVLTLSPVRVAEGRERQDAARPAVGWGQTNWVAAPATWQLFGLDGSPGLAPGLCREGTKSRLRPGRRGPHTDRRPIVPRPPPTGRDSHGHPTPAKLILLTAVSCGQINSISADFSVPNWFVFFPFAYTTQAELQRKQNHHKQSCNASSIAMLAEPPRATTKLQTSSAATRAGSATSWICRHERGPNFKRANSAPRVRAAATSWFWRHKGEQRARLHFWSRRLREQRYITASADVDCDRYRSHGLSRRIGEAVSSGTPPRAVVSSEDNQINNQSQSKVVCSEPSQNAVDYQNKSNQTQPKSKQSSQCKTTTASSSANQSNLIDEQSKAILGSQV
ncbi:hypothetical protein ACLKA7_005010 [Drosophila subpalustris]